MKNSKIGLIFYHVRNNFCTINFYRYDHKISFISKISQFYHVTIILNFINLISENLVTGAGPMCKSEGFMHLSGKNFELGKSLVFEFDLC